MILKYIFDRITALAGLIFLSPILLLTWILIHIKMPDGPAIFTQKRVGKDGKLFTMYKFRSMSQHHSGSSVSVAGESRITPLGAKLRKYKIDELPELWNVLIGNMSFVGPRPDVQGYADKLEGEDRDILKLRHEEELLAKQDNPQEYNDFVIYPDKVRINLFYLKHYSFIMDIKIIIATVTGKRISYNNEII